MGSSKLIGVVLAIYIMYGVGVYHEIYEDPERDVYIGKALEWVKNRTVKNAAPEKLMSKM